MGRTDKNVEEKIENGGGRTAGEIVKLRRLELLSEFVGQLAKNTYSEGNSPFLLECKRFYIHGDEQEEKKKISLQHVNRWHRNQMKDIQPMDLYLHQCMQVQVENQGIIKQNR